MSRANVGPRWIVYKDDSYYPWVWWVQRVPVCEDDGIGGNDDRSSIDGSNYETWHEAIRAANEGAMLDRAKLCK